MHGSDGWASAGTGRVLLMKKVSRHDEGPERGLVVGVDAGCTAAQQWYRQLLITFSPPTRALSAENRRATNVAIIANSVAVSI
jgi:hypothetical protein